MSDLVSVDNHPKPLSRIFILDIESKPQVNLVRLCESEIKPSKTLKDPEKINIDIKKKKLALRKKMSVDPDLADIICIGVKRLNEEPKLYTPKEMGRLFDDNPGAVFVTYNGKGFDIPLLIKYGLKNNLDYPYRELKNMCKKWQTNYHYDLMEIINDKNPKSLDLLLQIYLGIKKKPIDFNTASEEEIKEHCIEDIINTEKLYKLFEKII